VFTNGKVTKVYPLPSTSSANLTNSLQDFADDVGIPSLIHLDLAAAVEGRRTDFQKLVRYLRTKMKYTELGRLNQNHAAEREIGEFKEALATSYLQETVSTQGLGLWSRV
jgi:hypothetical protein